MAQEEYRLLATALLLSRFTKAELAKAAAANLNTVGSWIDRNGRFFDITTAANAARGTAQGLALREDAAKKMQEHPETGSGNSFDDF